ncbi:CoA transferase [Kineococcus radiotolerans]|uniref:L-carnitine dehydratase/bile acid-inducible protein F n=1 Tax=Kineococcus radiotolerans (strain ATCC BAA-149 / DSM 14245 / SRS30216) TaxID=266940 RepID=A6WBB7_KINRD|nr:CoA transferase [Kineococcus radiotolerans]ABS04106.1 L-carnitine dehydratase/bile acid-inducible protein F [Kineococcus radiotolerans SRS30216 = ATCC BAA-149]
MSTELLHHTWQALHGNPHHLTRLRVTGQADLPSPLPVAALAVDTVAVQLLAAAALAAPAGASERDGDPDQQGEVVVNATHVGISFRSERLLRINGAPAGAGFAPLSRFTPAADGWVRLHANYPHHATALHHALGSDPLRTIADMGRFEVEDVVTAAGGIAAAVRTRTEWATHPAATAVAAAPLLDLHQVPRSTAGTTSHAASHVPGQLTRPRWQPTPRPVVGDQHSPARPMRGPLPGLLPGLLAGLRVLDLTRVIAGPLTTRTLASYGADVLRIDHPHLPEDHATWLETGPGKRCTTLDLTQRNDRHRFDQLLAEADVLVHGYRPGALARHGLDEATLAREHPHLVVASLSAWGVTGPWGNRRGFDSTVQAATGIAHLTRTVDKTGERATGDRGPGDPTSTPTAPIPHGWRPGVLPAQALDHGSGHLLAAAVLRALDLTRRHGGPWHAQLSLAGLAQRLLPDLQPTAPRMPTSQVLAQPTDPQDSDQAKYLVNVPSDAGTLTLVTPPGSPAWAAGPRHTPPAATTWWR